jgi:hypothetical protein
MQEKRMHVPVGSVPVENQLEAQAVTPLVKRVWHMHGLRAAWYAMKGKEDRAVIFFLG